MGSEAELYAIYQAIHTAIDERLTAFRAVYDEGSDKDLFKELCFCTLTPQNDAVRAWQAVCALDAQGLLGVCEPAALGGLLRDHGVRFHNNKARYIVQNQAVFYPDTRARLADILTGQRVREARGALADTVMGWGLKEASHFLRNIGLGGSLCILDRHIIRRLVEYHVIRAEELGALTPKVYLAIEQKMQHFAERVGIPLDALDLVFWYEEKRMLFK